MADMLDIHEYCVLTSVDTILVVGFPRTISNGGGSTFLTCVGWITILSIKMDRALRTGCESINGISAQWAGLCEMKGKMKCL